MANSMSKCVKCPFFHTYYPNKIVCEGLKKGNTINLVYESTSEKARYMKDKCCSIEGYQTCCVYKMLYDRYDK